MVTSRIKGKLFLDILYHFRQSIKLVAAVQFILFFTSTIFLLRVMRKVFFIKDWLYLLAGILLLSEPVALYHCNSVLSDLLFMVLTIFSLGFLILYIHERYYSLFIIHLVFVFLCIEVRHVALFYPFFSCMVLVLFGSRTRVLALNIIVLSVSYLALYNWHIQQHKKKYGVSVYSPFSGWTHANNALYGSSLIASSDIKDPEIRKMHDYFKTTIAVNNFTVGSIGSGYLWEDKSPLNVIRQRLTDSIKCDYTTSWFLCAPGFAKYGSYIQKNFPMVYVKSYMIPNFQTLLHPVYGEMGDYNITSLYSAFTKTRYHLKEEDQTSPRQIYKESINPLLPAAYTLELILFLLSSFLFLIFHKRFENGSKKALFTLISFVFLFYGLTLYSSWFMFRYLIPVFPLMLITILIVWQTLIQKLILSSKENPS